MIRSITASNPGPYTLDGTRTYLVGDDVVIDPGPDIAAHVESIVREQPSLRTILITHRHGDHAPAAVPLKKRTGARIFAPENVLPSETDRILRDGGIVETSSGPIEVIATPGHTREHVCFLTDRGDLFTGDTILGFGTTTIFPPDGNMADYIASLRKLRARAPKTIWPAHGPERTDAVALIDEYIQHRLMREEQTLAALKSGAKSTVQLRHAIYPELAAALHHAAEIQLEAHLDKLLGEQRVIRLSDGRFDLVDP